MHFFLHVAEEVREILAALGARSLDDVVGRTELLHQVARGHGEADGLDLAALLVRVDQDGAAIRHSGAANGRVSLGRLNARLLADAAPAFDGVPVTLCYDLTNQDRTFGATLSGAIAARYGDTGLPEGAVTVQARGAAGQSFGAFLAPGVRLLLTGEANDYVGKGMGGGEIVVRPPAGARFAPEENTILGNTVLYGATGGALYAAGRAGERFAVRNSGAVAVVEGVGDHGCEYMTGGVVLVLGPTGRNFAASMTGGLAYVLDRAGDFAGRCNQELVTVGALDPPDEHNVQTLLVRHQERTGSPYAAALLRDWAGVCLQFRRVQPRDLALPALPHPLQQLPPAVAAAEPAA